MHDADLLLHVVDAGAKDLDAHIASVETVLQSLTLDRIPRVLVFNKCDQLTSGQAEALCRRYSAIGISSLHQETLAPLIQHLEERLFTRASVDGSSKKPTA
jgi:GTP-binding protein HflX